MLYYYQYTWYAARVLDAPGVSPPVLSSSLVLLARDLDCAPGIVMATNLLTGMEVGVALKQVRALLHGGAEHVRALLRGRLQSHAPTPPAGPRHSCQPTVPYITPSMAFPSVKVVVRGRRRFRTRCAVLAYSWLPAPLRGY